MNWVLICYEVVCTKPAFLKENLMRVLFSKFHCPSFICFCKPSPHLLSSSPLKLENTPHGPSTLSAVSDATADSSNTKCEVENDCLDGDQESENLPNQASDNLLKSSLKKPSSELGSGKDIERRKVQWMDFLGKELVEIKEFEMRSAEWIHLHPHLLVGNFLDLSGLSTHQAPLCSAYWMPPYFCGFMSPLS